MPAPGGHQLDGQRQPAQPAYQRGERRQLGGSGRLPADLGEPGGEQRDRRPAIRAPPGPSRSASGGGTSSGATGQTRSPGSPTGCRPVTSTRSEGSAPERAGAPSRPPASGRAPPRPSPAAPAGRRAGRTSSGSRATPKHRDRGGEHVGRVRALADQHPGRPRPGGRRPPRAPPTRQRGLADAGQPDQADQPGPAVRGQQPGQLGQVAVPADQRDRRRERDRRTGGCGSTVVPRTASAVEVVSGAGRPGPAPAGRGQERRPAGPASASAPASSSTVVRCGRTDRPRSRSRTVRTPTPARAASSAWVRPAASRCPRNSSGRPVRPAGLRDRS